MLSTWRETYHMEITDAQTSVIGLGFSANARYLAIAHGTRVDIWDLKDTIDTTPLVRYENENQICSITWSSKKPQLVICFEGGLIYVVTMQEQSTLIVGFRHSIGHQQAKVSAVFLSGDLLAVAMGNTVEIRRYHIGNEHPDWMLLATLPPPPTVKELENYAVDNIHSIHAIAEDCILLSYENGLTISWSYVQSELNPTTITFQHKDTTLLPGVINDVCSDRRAILVTASGTYQVFLLGSAVPQHIFIPRNLLSKAPQAVSCAKFLSNDMIIGAGIGQLVLWNAELGNRLQNLVFRDQETKVICGICSAYSSEKDSAWIVTARGSEITFWGMTDVSSGEESKRELNLDNVQAS
ncbi:hypothetical protein F5879DRAFT_979891 [Lentinula edodes]|nr:hypothetical protein F5879DRAFT_979891 [Lentinula edodes]